MSLYRQLILAITLLIAVLMAANVFVSILNARGYVYEQMQVHAQDTATSLGLTLSHVAKEKDKAQIESFIDVVFDRGYYRHIVYRNLGEDGFVVQRNLPLVIEGVPNWFIHLVSLDEPTGRSEVMSGWYRLGELVVTSHPGFAYRDLWRIFREQLWLFFFTAVLSYGLAGLALHYLLRPLKTIEQQADAISRREFLVHTPLPRTPEFRRLVEAMNRTADKLKSIFDEQVELSQRLHQQAYLDPVTGLSNRRGFDSRLEAFIKSEKGGSGGMLLLIQVADLQRFNEAHGRESGDQLLAGLAEAMRGQFGAVPGAILSRRSGVDFCLFVPVLDEPAARADVELFVGRLHNVQWLQRSALALHVGVAWMDSVTIHNQLLERADLALRKAQSLGGVGAVWAEPQSNALPAKTANQWREIIVSAIEQQTIQFFFQPCFAADGKTILHQEVYCRLSDGEQLHNAGVFLPMVERFGLSTQLDRLIIDMIYRRFRQLGLEVGLAVNISSASIQDEFFVSWLEGVLRRDVGFARKVVFELPEQALIRNQTAVRSFASRMQYVGTGIVIDHFGEASSAFQYLQSVPIEMVKVSRSFTADLAHNADNQFFFRSLVQIVHNCDITLLAEGVETESEWAQLLDLGVDGGQGFWLGKPSSSRWSDV